MLLSLFPRNLPRMLIAITRKPLSASISRIVKTVSYRIEFPTFLADSVLVATYARQPRHADSRVAYLRQDVVHRLARLDVALAQHAQETEHLDLQERVRDAAHVVLRRVSRRDERLEMTNKQRHRLRESVGESCESRAHLAERVAADETAHLSD